jgi:signal transduction histidine kinase
LIEIEDEGPGFSAEDKRRAFQEFQTLSAKPTGGEAATGLGLKICRDIVAAHGGSITIRDGENHRGACLVVKLPLLLEAPSPRRERARARDAEL